MNNNYFKFNSEEALISKCIDIVFITTSNNLDYFSFSLTLIVVILLLQ